MLKENYVNLRDTPKVRVKKCGDCAAAYRERFDERIYMGCQKLDIMLKDVFSGDKLREDDAFISRNKVDYKW